ncbi:MAG: hypothetical protein EOR78_27870 [Mesorhizobium sp.]|nr:MAG: hypothetical protein EOR49_22745 [Mesorhizobium sp.]RWM45595.1 MAG: hypothetical protein EOR79_35680 [Mesorhizobium sp.]RWM49472.1 MAG: hypothetical protein EOR78_27870 [Mesorhizobium sp.]RWM53682.1 MAG: hypothetical protein EOR76_00220 [Mesorhizobium sp.]RWM93931.1 MAG: hypothetical protein EOR85_26690 [Mesorhizobium sp.]
MAAGGRSAATLHRAQSKSQILCAEELVISGTPYVVAYRMKDTKIEVLFIQHWAREWPGEVRADVHGCSS